MPQRTAEKFLQDLSTSGLLTPEQHAQLDERLRNVKETPEPKKLAKNLVKSAWLNRWQAEMLLNGQTGLKLGDYRMLGILGRGGMGTVFRAKDPVKKREVAIKVMAKKLAKNETLVTRFKREIQAVMAVDSPNVVRAYDAGRIGHMLFLVMEVVEGGDIETIIQNGKQLPPTIACELVRQAAVGLQAAHDQQLVHRDMKPGNLILTWPDQSSPVVKIIDMGLVRSTRKVDNNGVTRDGQTMGTPDYMAPEQALDAQQADIRADIYSLGCTLYRMITGDVPFKGGNALKVLLVRCQQEPPQIVDKIPDIDPSINAIVLKMMAREVGDRYQTPQEAAHALAAVAEVPQQADLQTMIDAAKTISSQKTAMKIADNRLDQFLNALAGGDADMISTSGHDLGGLGQRQAELATSVDFATHTVESSSRTSIRKTKSNGLVAAICLAAMACLVGAIWYVQSNPGESSAAAGDTGDAKTKSIATKESDQSEPPKKKSVLTPPQDNQFSAGSLVSFSVRAIEFLNSEDEIVYQLDEKGHDDAVVDPSTGQFRWEPDQMMSAGDYKFTVSARSASGELVEGPVEFTVKLKSLHKHGIGDFSPREVVAGETVEVPIRVIGPLQQQFKVVLECDTVKNPKRLVKGRTFKWVTSSKDVGEHLFKMKVVPKKGEDVIAESELKITVINAPKTREVDLASQTATVGQLFTLEPKGQNSELTSADKQFRLKSGPDGLQLTDRRIEWTPSETQVGNHNVTIEVIDSAMSDMVFARASFEIEVQAASSPPSIASSNLPGEKEIAAAKEEIETVFKRDISGARSVPARRELAAKLFDAAIKSESPSQKYVLLNMSREFAIKGRDYLHVFQCVDELADVYSIDAPDLVSEAFEGIRTREVAAADRPVMYEFLVEQVAVAVQADKWDRVDSLMKHARLIATAERNADMKEHAQRITQLAETANGGDKGGDEGKTSDAADLSRQQLVDLLQRSRFQHLFRDASRFIFLEHSLGDVDDKGKSLWTINNGRLQIKTTDAVSSGFIDQTSQFENFVLRMDLAPGTSNGKLIIGALPVTGEVQAFEVHFGTNQFGYVRLSGDADVIARPRTRIKPDLNRWDHLEIEVRESTLAVRLNGKAIVETALERPPNGYVGLDVQLPAGQSFAVRNARIRSL